MLFTNKKQFGVTSNINLNSYHIAYSNLSIVKTPLGYTVGSSTSIADTKELAIKKVYSEYLERFSLGINVSSLTEIKAIHAITKTICSEQAGFFAYGDSKYGHSDSTGTASGTNSLAIERKAILELIEKNDCLCFWYSNIGVRLNLAEFEEYIKHLNFISTNFRAYVVSEISNYYSVIFIGFHNGKMLCNGIACSNNIINACTTAIQEAKTIEWQQYSNPQSSIFGLSKKYNQAVMEKLNLLDSKAFKYRASDFSTVDDLHLAGWVKDLKIALIGIDSKLGLKSIKCISNDLISCVPTMQNIEKYTNKTVVKKYYIDRSVDCSIV